MKKLFKLLFGRLTIIALAIILQFVLFVWWVTDASLQYNWLYAINVVLGVLVFINIVNRKMNTESKLTWVAVVLLMPIFGFMAYVMFSESRLSPRQRRAYRDIYYVSKDSLEYYFARSGGKLPDTGDYLGQNVYIKNLNNLPSYTDTATEYYPWGIDFWEALKTDLKRAEKFIFMEYFIIEEGVMWNEILEILAEKAQAGVEVRFMYDDIGSISKVPARYYKKMEKLGIKTLRFNPFRPFLTGIHNNRDHRKITVIDGVIGFIGGANLADEYINKTSPYGIWKDSAVRLEGEAVRSLTVNFLQMFDMQRENAEDFAPYLEAETSVRAEGVVQPFVDGPKPIYDDYVAKNVYLNLFNSAKRYLYITTPYLIPDGEIVNALQLAAARGVDVRIITPQIPDKKLVFNITRSNYKRLMNYGVKIYEFKGGFIHAKNVLCDDAVGIVGTINLDYRSLMHHYECGVWMYRTAALSAMKADFEATFSQSVLQDEKSVKMGIVKRLFCGVCAIFAPLL
ncbi:MAG: cardiolipin synthase [Eubacteriales bacterium]